MPDLFNTFDNSPLIANNLYQKQLSNSVAIEYLDSGLKKGVWVYFIILIFEGALRKWVLPGLATPLLVIRDPIAIGLVFIAWKRGLLPGNFSMTGMMIIGLISIFTAFYLGHGNLAVALFGARIFLFHFPMIFVIEKFLTILMYSNWVRFVCGYLYL